VEIISKKFPSRFFTTKATLAIDEETKLQEEAKRAQTRYIPDILPRRHTQTVIGKKQIFIQLKFGLCNKYYGYLCNDIFVVI